MSVLDGLPAPAELSRPAAALGGATAMQTIPRAELTGVTDPPAPLRLLVVDAHPIVRWALVQIVDHHSGLQAVGEATTPSEAMTMTYALKPDVVTIECSSPEAWDLVAKLRGDYPRLGIVVLTADDSDAMLFRTLNLGGSAFVPKSAPVQDVVAAIRHAGASPDSFTASGLANALRRRRTVRETVTLSGREHQILVLLHHGLSVPEIAAQLFVSLSTSKTYVARLYDKLGARNRAQALMAAVRLGLLTDEISDVG